jgi:hypothetical protein
MVLTPPVSNSLPVSASAAAQASTAPAINAIFQKECVMVKSYKKRVS